MLGRRLGDQRVAHGDVTERDLGLEALVPIVHPLADARAHVGREVGLLRDATRQLVGQDERGLGRAGRPPSLQGSRLEPQQRGHDPGCRGEEHRDDRDRCGQVPGEQLRGGEERPSEDQRHLEDVLRHLVHHLHARFDARTDPPQSAEPLDEERATAHDRGLAIGAEHLLDGLEALDLSVHRVAARALGPPRDQPVQAHPHAGEEQDREDGDRGVDEEQADREHGEQGRLGRDHDALADDAERDAADAVGERVADLLARPALHVEQRLGQELGRQPARDGRLPTRQERERPAGGEEAERALGDHEQAGEHCESHGQRVGIVLGDPEALEEVVDDRRDRARGRARGEQRDEADEHDGDQVEQGQRGLQRRDDDQQPPIPGADEPQCGAEVGPESHPASHPCALSRVTA